jgi:hypothetical protein
VIVEPVADHQHRMAGLLERFDGRDLVGRPCRRSAGEAKPARDGVDARGGVAGKNFELKAGRFQLGDRLACAGAQAVGEIERRDRLSVLR